MADQEEDDYVSYGTPLEREEDLAPSKRRKALEQGNLRTLAPWHQEVFDESGRRRFHGAFTGGFSAGYYNTVGSKEGWAPQTFTSSRKQRAGLVQQRAYDFMDDDEKAEVDSTKLSAATEFDTFGFTAAEVARQEVAQELKKRPSAIPGLPPDEIIVPVSDSIGFKLLLKMGWRHGRAIGPSHIAASSEARREGRKALLALAQSHEAGNSKQMSNDAEMSEGRHNTNESEYGETEDSEIVPRSTPIYVINPKNDYYGLGYDPYKNAPEFQERKRSVVAEGSTDRSRSWIRQQESVSKPSLFRPNVGRMGSGFGIGALEELDEEDEDVYTSGFEVEIVASDEEACPSSTKGHQKPVIAETKQGALPGFKPALISGFKVERFPPPMVPPDFVAVHQFPDSLEAERALSRPEPAKASPPEDTELRKMIEGLATFVARSGQKVESIYMEIRKDDPKFQFLFGGNGHSYYRRRLWEEQQKLAKEGKSQVILHNTNKETVLDSAQRGEILGEIALDRKTLPDAPSIAPEDHARLQSALSSAFTKSSSQGDNSLSKSQIFESNPAKQARFDLFLKDKFQGGLRKAVGVGEGSLTEWQRAHETLEFEAACHNLQTSGSSKYDMNEAGGLNLRSLQAIMSDRFASPASDKALEKTQKEPAADKYPRREEQPWRPLPLLCKRFNLSDPYLGKPPPLPKPRSRMDSFILLSNPVTKDLETSVSEKQKVLTARLEVEDLSLSGKQDNAPSSVIDTSDHEGPVNNIYEKPVDLYKAIFSDDSEDDDSENPGEPKVEDRAAEAAQAALNRMEAGDFLVSLGKELGLKVPPAESSHIKSGKDTLSHTRDTNFLTKTLISSQDTKHGHQQHSKLDLINNVVAQPAGIVQKQSAKDPDNTEANPSGQSYGRSMKAGVYARPLKDELFQETKEKPTISSVLEPQILVEKNQRSVNEAKESSLKNESVPEDSSSEDDSDSYERRRREPKRRKNDLIDTRRHKRKDRTHHKDKKREKSNEHRSHKHQHHSKRRRHKSRNGDSK